MAKREGLQHLKLQYTNTALAYAALTSLHGGISFQIAVCITVLAKCLGFKVRQILSIFILISVCIYFLFLCITCLFIFSLSLADRAM